MSEIDIPGTLKSQNGLTLDYSYFQKKGGHASMLFL